MKKTKRTAHLMSEISNGTWHVRTINGYKSFYTPLVKAWRGIQKEFNIER